MLAEMIVEARAYLALCERRLDEAKTALAERVRERDAHEGHHRGEDRLRSGLDASQAQELRPLEFDVQRAAGRVEGLVAAQEAVG